MKPEWRTKYIVAAARTGKLNPPMLWGPSSPLPKRFFMSFGVVHLREHTVSVKWEGSKYLHPSDR